MPSAAQAQRATFDALETFGTGPGRTGVGTTPGDVAVDADGSVWVIDLPGNRVVKYTYEGDFVTAVDSPELRNPVGVGTDDRGFVYVADRGTLADTDSQQVVKLDAGGDVVQRIRFVDEPGGDFYPNDVAVRPDGELLIAGDARILRYRPNGTLIDTFATYASSLGNNQIAVTPGGDVVWISDQALGTLDRARSSGESDTSWVDAAGAAGVTGFGTTAVYGLATDSDGHVYTSLRLASPPRVIRLGPGGAVVQDISSGLRFPLGVAVDCRRNLYVADPAAGGAAGPGRILKFGDPAAKPPPCAPPRALAGTVDARIDDIEVTQGVQPLRDFTRSGSTRAYGGQVDEVPLRIRGKTVVRVYASLRSGPRGGIANVPAILEGPGLGRISPDAGPPLLRVGEEAVGGARRSRSSAAYTFTLPPSWTERSRLELTARVNPANIGCDAACRERATFRLTGIPFRRTVTPNNFDVPPNVGVWAVALTFDGRRPLERDSPQPFFDVARALTPLELQITGWMGDIEVGDLNRAGRTKTEECVLGIELGILCDEEEKPVTREELEGQLMERLERFKEERGIGSGTVLIGLIGRSGGELVRGELPGAMRGDLLEGDGALGYADVGRPYTAVAHELQHALGRPHAGTSPACGYPAGQLGEPWPPDERGLLQGIGLDTRAGSGGRRGPYRILAPSRAVGGGARWFDLMSYCADTGDTNSWISPKGWRDVIGYKAPPPAASARAVIPRGAGSGTGRTLGVVAVELADRSLVITGLSPRGGPERRAPASSPYRLEVRDAAGRILRSVPVLARRLDDGGGNLISADIARPPGTAQVVLRRGREAATRRRRSASPPAVRLLAPSRARKVRGRTLDVRWRATDRDDDRLTAVVQYTADGRRWRTINVGPAARARLAVPVRQLAPARRGRVRVLVDDGFDEAVAVSAPLDVRGAPPNVRIADPMRATTIRADGRLYLRAEATGDGGLPLRARAYAWYDGRRLLGRGNPISVAAPEAGRRRVRVVARQGTRQAARALRVQVTPVRPAFLRLGAPRRLGPRARVLRLRVAATVTATLRVGRQRFRVGRGVRTVRVRVRAGRAPLRVTLRLRAGRLQVRQALAVRRT